MANSYTVLTSKPQKGDPYLYLYNNRNRNGKSLCIDGKPVDSTCNVLCNCVGWACGRFNHIYNILTGYNDIKYPRFCCNAENFIEIARDYGLRVGTTPKPGAIMVWQKGKTLKGKDGAGHVAVVEKVFSKDKIMTSESGYNSFAFANRTRSNSNGNWGVGSTYKFRGFIYNPAVNDQTVVLSDIPDLPTPVARNKFVDQIQVKIPDLNVRVNKGTNFKSIGFAKPGYYSYSATGTSDGKTWYEIGEKAWVAYSPKWCTLYPKFIPEPEKKPVEAKFRVGDEVTIQRNAPIYGSKSKFASWVYNSKLYVRGVNGDRITVSIYRTGPVTGAVDQKYLKKA